VSFVVYPTVLEHDQKQLAGLHKNAEPGVQIAFASEMAPSCNVVRLRLVYCRELSDLVTPYYQSGLKKVLADRATALFLTPSLNLLVFENNRSDSTSRPAMDIQRCCNAKSSEPMQ